MNRAISWGSGLLDEIELVYKRGEENENIGKALEKLEQTALMEAKENCGEGGLLPEIVGAVLPPEAFDEMSNINKETAIKYLAGMGLLRLSIERSTAEIIVRLSPNIQRIVACTMFELINRIEKLDGSLNVTVSPKWTLCLRIPLGCRKGLFEWEMLIMQMYPWISVKETGPEG